MEKIVSWMKKFFRWIVMFVAVALLAVTVVFFLLPAVFGDALPWIVEGEGQYRTDRYCGLYQGLAYGNGYTVFYLLDGEKLDRVFLKSDFQPIEVEEGLKLQLGAPICVLRHHKPTGAPDYASIERW